MSHLYSHLPNLLLVFSAFAVAVGSPGPSNMMIMATAMDAGRKPALVLALSVTTGSFTWGILSAIGVSAMIAAHAGAIVVIKIAGGMYLLYLAWRSGRSALRKDAALHAASVSAHQSFGRIYMRGYLMHLTNPKAIIGWTAIMRARFDTRCTASGPGCHACGLPADFIHAELRLCPRLFHHTDDQRLSPRAALD